MLIHVIDHFLAPALLFPPFLAAFFLWVFFALLFGVAALTGVAAAPASAGAAAGAAFFTLLA